MKNRLVVAAAGMMSIIGLLCVPARAAAAAEAPTEKELAKEIFAIMSQIQGNHPGFRPTHAKGIVCKGTFTPSPEAAAVSKAAHFQKAAVPITVRFSAGSPDPIIPDASPNAGPRGMAIRFTLPDGTETDIVSMSHNGFVVSNGEEFLAIQKAIAATDPTKAHPWPIEAFLGTHPLALKFVQENTIASASFATQGFFSNDSFTFINKAGVKQIGRYKIIPDAGLHVLTEAEAKGKAPNYLADDLKTRLAAGPVKFHLIAQLPNPGDSTSDPSQVWPDDRKTIDLGSLSIASIVADSAAAEKELAFDPTTLTDGIDLSDDALPSLRSRVYALSVKHRQQKQ